MTRKLLALALFAATPALADYERLEAQGSVPEVIDRLEAAVTEAGATVFARVDHGAGAESAGMALADSQLLIFGNPKLGTPVMQADIRAGLHLPLKILVHADAEGRTWLAWEEVDAMLDDLDGGDDLPEIGQMGGALRKFAETAAGN